MRDCPECAAPVQFRDDDTADFTRCAVCGAFVERSIAGQPDTAVAARSDTPVDPGSGRDGNPLRRVRNRLLCAVRQHFALVPDAAPSSRGARVARDLTVFGSNTPMSSPRPSESTNAQDQGDPNFETMLECARTIVESIHLATSNAERVEQEFERRQNALDHELDNRRGLVAHEGAAAAQRLSEAEFLRSDIAREVAGTRRQTLDHCTEQSLPKPRSNAVDLELTSDEIDRILSQADPAARSRRFASSASSALYQLSVIKRPRVWYAFGDRLVEGVAALTGVAGLAALFTGRLNFVLFLTLAVVAWGGFSIIAHRRRIARSSGLVDAILRDAARALQVAVAFRNNVEDRSAQETAKLEQKLAKYVSGPHALAKKLCAQEREAAVAAAEAECQALIEDLEAELASFRASVGFSGAAWDASEWRAWQAPEGGNRPPEASIRIGTLCLSPSGTDPIRDRFCHLEVPAMAPVARAPVVVEYSPATRLRAVNAFQALLTRLLATSPPGRVQFLFLDPLGLGQSVAPFMPLGEIDRSIITSMAWSEPRDIEARLGEIVGQMERVIQQRLQDRYASIGEYNARNPESPEPYRVVVSLDFPTACSETAARRLLSICQHGARCGVFSIILHDVTKSPPHGFPIDPILASSTVLQVKQESTYWLGLELDDWRVRLDNAPPQATVGRIVDSLRDPVRRGLKVEFEFERVLERASLSASTWDDPVDRAARATLLRAPIGIRDGAKPQYLELGGSRGHHALLIGRTGSGKSNLLHVVITSLSLRYRPEELELYLVDFKQGVEFKPYAERRLPHARVVAIESEPEFGLSVLRRLDEELVHRSKRFREAGVSSRKEYNATAGAGSQVPWTVLLVDEFQEFFTGDPTIARASAEVLDRLVRQGRSAGIHVLLASQSVNQVSAGAAASGLKAIFGQMGVRIALQCAQADAELVFASDNTAARLLSRPGEGIYNDQNGLREGNSQFQAPRFGEETLREELDRIFDRAGRPDVKQFVFEGSEPAKLPRPPDFARLSTAGRKPRTLAALVGEPISISSPVALRLSRQSGANALLVTRDESQALGLLASLVASLWSQESGDTLRVEIVDLLDPDCAPSEDVCSLGWLPEAFGSGVQVVGRRGLAAMLAKLDAEVSARVAADAASGPRVVLVVAGIHRARELQVDDFGVPAAGTPQGHLARILREGPEVGVHVVAWCDGLKSLGMVCQRKSVAEFGLRVTGPLTADDSRRLIDDEAASTLRRDNQMILHDADRPGRLEKFRPFAAPTRSWIMGISQLHRPLGGTPA